jgi:hypothetical protein
MLQVNETVREYTDALVTNVWADGVNRTPCMAFTHNPAADRTCLDQANKSALRGRATRVATAKAQIKELDRLLKKYKIDKERLVYMAPKKKGSKYCAESREIYKAFIALYEEKDNRTFGANCFLVHDAGNAYKEPQSKKSKVCESIMKTKKVGRYAVLPPIVHHAISVNDHSLHAVMKALWNALKDLESDLESTLALMHFADEVKGETIKAWFTRNYAYEAHNKGDEAITKAMGALVFKPAQLWNPYHDSCLEAYLQRFPSERDLILKPKAVKPKAGTVHGRKKK